MKPTLQSGEQFAQDVNLSGSKFENVNLSVSQFHDVNLSGCVFEDIKLSGAQFKNVCFGDVAISDADYTGMTIDGIPVDELLDVYAQSELADDEE